MKNFDQFLAEIYTNEEFRLLPKEKMDRKLKDRQAKGEGQWAKTKRFRAIRNHLGKITDTTKKLFDDETEKVYNDIELRNFRTYNKDGSQDEDKWEKVVHTPKSHVGNVRSAISRSKGPSRNRFNSQEDNIKNIEKTNKRQIEYNKQQTQNRRDLISKRSGL